MDKLSRKYLNQAIKRLGRVYGLDEEGEASLKGAIEIAKQERITERDKAVIEPSADEVQLPAD